MRQNPKPVVLLLAAAFPGLALAQSVETRLDPVVVTGSRIEHNSFDLPAAVDVVDSSRIGADQARVNASEALASVPGISVQNRQNYAQDLQISSRGFGARSAFGVRGIRLVADGIPASMPDGQGQAASFNLDRAERIEVMRGPMSSVYGNHAGGVIQLFTADGKGAPTVEGGFVAGSYGTWKADVAAQGEAGGLGYVLDASRFATDGYRDHSSAQRDQTSAKLTYAPDEYSRLMFVANGFTQKADDPLGQSWNTFRNNPRGSESVAEQYDTRKTIDHMQGGLSYERRFGDQTVQVSAYAGQRSVIQYQSIPRSAQLITGSTLPNAAVRKHSGGVIDFDRDFSGLASRWIGNFALAGGKLTTTVGFDYEQSTDDRKGYENYLSATVLGVKGALRRNEQDRVASFDQYAQAEWQGERWTFNGGVRHSRVAFKVDDHYIATGNGNDSGSVSYEQTTPMAAVLYKLSPAVNLYFSAARGFETPTLNELFYSGSNGGFSYDLKAATSTHLETGIKAYVGDDSRLDVALFQIKTNDELVVASSSGGRTAYRNAGQTTRRGLEAALDSRWGGGFTSRLVYTGLDARYDEAFTTTVLGVATAVDAGKRLPGVATHTLFGELAWRHAASGFHAAVETIARSKVYVEDSNTQQAAPSYAIANLRVGLDRQLGPLNLRGFIRLDNVFDRQYVGSVVVGDGNGRFYESAPGRNWLFGLSARYAF
ncbi:MAG: TonB-dependent receptor [Rhodocyclales bacterium GT-UBC]|nr:MAG: TonB-dependent receptor [Rhodocyclales bacterium GT-UBC]